MIVDERTYRTELIGPATLGLAGLIAPGRTWALCIDAALVADTDEPMTAQQAQHWAHRMLGEHVTFLPGDDQGSYWVANPDSRGGH
jgi:hypothetical protein